MSDSKLTLRQSFFDDLWPYILWDNVCDTHSTNTTEYFTPVERFDNVWAHALLAEKGYRNYCPPIELRCRFDAEAESEAEIESVSAATATTEEDDEHECNKDDLARTHGPTAVQLNEQFDALEQETKKRRCLADAFVNRQYPWFMKKPQYEDNFSITEDMRETFCCAFEFEILQQVCDCNCKLMIVDLSAKVCLHELERWIKFTSYVFIIIVARSEDAVRKVCALGEGFSSVLSVDDMENTWQEQLTSDLNTGVAHAMALGHIEHCAKLIAFAFSRTRNSTTTDAFKMLRKA